MFIKKTILLFTLFVINLTLFAQSQKVTILADKMPIKTFFDQLQSKSNYYILYSDDVVPDSMRVSIQANQLSVPAILDQVLIGKGLSYSITKKGMVIITSFNQKKIKQSAFKSSISGFVNDKKEPVPFVSVTLIKSEKVISGCISEQNGGFLLEYPFSIGENYQLKITAIGFKNWIKDFTYPDTAFTKQIELQAETQKLSTLTVMGNRSLVIRKSDRYIIDVEGSYLANGLSGLDVLQKSPGIWVNSDGSIRIKGNQSVMVMINDVVQRMSSEDLAEYLRALKSEAIAKIEVISNPPSEFEASGTGGIIHIQLKKSRSDGMVTSLNAQYRQQNNRPFVSTGGLIDYKIKNFYLFGSAFLTRDESTYIGTYHIEYPNQRVYDSFTNRFNHNERFNYRLGMAYDLGKNHTISLQTIGSNSKLEQYFNTDINYQPLEGYTTSRWLRHPKQSSTTFNYVWKIDSVGTMLKIIGDYAYARKTELNQFEGIYTDATLYTMFRTNTPNTTRIYSFQTDFTKPLPHKAEFKTGFKYSGTSRDNKLITENYLNNNWNFNETGSNHFIYDEKLFMAYASIEKTFKNTSIKAGLRGEETVTDGNSVTSSETFNRNYFGLFPSFFINHNFNVQKNSAVHFSYSRRLQRPAYKELNPYRLQINDLIVNIGNPDLQPQYTHNFELGVDLKNGYSTNIYLAKTNNAIAEFAQPINTNVLEYQVRNFSSNTSYGANINVPIKVNSWWNMNTGISAFHSSYLLNGIRNSQASISAKLVQTLNFPKLFNVSIYSEYRSPYVRGNSRFAKVLFTELGFSRKIFKNEKGRIQLYFEDIFNTFYEAEITNYNHTMIDFYQKRPTRTASIQFSYTITSGKKFTNKKIDQSNAEEKNRLGN